MFCCDFCFSFLLRSETTSAAWGEIFGRLSNQNSWLFVTFSDPKLTAPLLAGQPLNYFLEILEMHKLSCLNHKRNVAMKFMNKLTTAYRWRSFALAYNKVQITRLFSSLYWFTHFHNLWFEQKKYRLKSRKKLTCSLVMNPSLSIANSLARRRERQTYRKVEDALRLTWVG